MQSALVLLLLLSIGVVAARSEASKLELFCGGQYVSLKTVGELDELIEEIDSSGASCSQRTLKALNDLKAITEHKRGCTLDKAQAIEKFVNEHLRKSIGEIPKLLADFAIVYGMQTCDACSLATIASFSIEANARLHQRLSSVEYSRFRKLAKYLVEGSPVGIALSPAVEKGGLILLAVLMEPEISKDIPRILLSDSDGRRALASVCAKLLQPVYEPILLPLTSLIRSGFLEGAKQASRQMADEDIRFWSTAVILCESSRTVKLTRDKRQEEPFDILKELDDAINNLMEVQYRTGVQVRNDESAGQCLGSDSELPNEVVEDSTSALVKMFDTNQEDIVRLREIILKYGVYIIRSMFGKGKSSQVFEKMSNLSKSSHGGRGKGFEAAKKPPPVESSKFPTADNYPLDGKPITSSKNLIQGCRNIWTPVGALINASFMLLISVTSLTSNSLLSLLHLKQKPKYSLSYFISQYFASFKKRRPNKGLGRMDTERFERLRSSIET